MTWLYYLIEANIYLSVFYAFYHFMLRGETFYNLNRWYLIGMPVFSFLIPFVTVDYSTSAKFITPEPLAPNIEPVTLVRGQAGHTLLLDNSFKDISPITSGDILLIIYGLIVFFFVWKTCYEIFKIVQLYSTSSKEKKGSITYITLKDNKEAFSFFNWLFLHPNLCQNKPVIVHEMTHIKEGHSFDTLFLDLLRCFNWFNPVCYLLFRAAKLNHEYLADRKVVGTFNKRHYADMLIHFAYNPPRYLAHSAFSITQIERRIMRLGQQRSGRSAAFKYVIILPLLGLVFFITGFKIDKSYGFIDLHIKSAVTVDKEIAPGMMPLSKTERYKPAVKPESTNANSNHDPDRAGKKEKSLPLVVNKQLSELVEGETTLSKIAKAKGGKLYAIDYWLHWTINEGNKKIRKPVHSTSLGTEAQLFRGNFADTLYVDQGFYSYNKGIITVNTENLLIGYPDSNPHNDKKLIVIDAFSGQIVHRIDRVDIRTKALISSVINNPDFGYIRQNDPDPIPEGYVDVKTRDAGRKFIMVASNNWIRTARITANEIVTNETKTPQDDRRQPGIIW